MIIPIRCFTCGKVIGSLYDEYQRRLDEGKKSSKEILDSLGLDRYCCRRMIVSHVDLIDEIIPFT